MNKKVIGAIFIGLGIIVFGLNQMRAEEELYKQLMPLAFIGLGSFRIYQGVQESK